MQHRPPAPKTSPNSCTFPFDCRTADPIDQDTAACKETASLCRLGAGWLQGTARRSRLHDILVTGPESSRFGIIEHHERPNILHCKILLLFRHFLGYYFDFRLWSSVHILLRVHGQSPFMRRGFGQNTWSCSCDVGRCLFFYTLDVLYNFDHVYPDLLVVHMGTFHSCSRISTSNRPS